MIPSEVNFVIYHANCTDGFGAAYAAWKLLGDDAQYYAAKHGDPPPKVSGKTVAILDFSYDHATIKKMISESDDLIVIDHHKSAMAELKGIPNVRFDLNHSGAVLAWNFFHPNVDPPKFIRYIEDRDLWNWQLPLSREFSAALDTVPKEFSAYLNFESELVFENAILNGKHILAYSNLMIERISFAASRRRYQGLDVMVINSSHWISEIGSKLSQECDFAMIWYHDHKRKKIKVSLRASHDHMDVSEIARSFGGGGHKLAAGFTLPPKFCIEDLFDLKP